MTPAQPLMSGAGDGAPNRSLPGGACEGPAEGITLSFCTRGDTRAPRESRVPTHLAAPGAPGEPRGCPRRTRPVPAAPQGRAGERAERAGHPGVRGGEREGGGGGGGAMERRLPSPCRSGWGGWRVGSEGLKRSRGRSMGGGEAALIFIRVSPSLSF